MGALSERSERSIEERLDELQRESELRRQELRELAAQLPAGVSRRAILRAVVADLAGAARNGTVVRRALGKAARTPAEAYRVVRYRLRRDDR
jgi:hypothetical protein